MQSCFIFLGVIFSVPCTSVKQVEILATLTFSSGCKRVAQKIDLVVEELEEQGEAGKEGLKEELWMRTDWKTVNEELWWASCKEAMLWSVAIPDWPKATYLLVQSCSLVVEPSEQETIDLRTTACCPFGLMKNRWNLFEYKYIYLHRGTIAF